MAGIIPGTLTIDGVTARLQEFRKAWQQAVDAPHMPSWKKELFSFLLTFTDEEETLPLHTSGTTGPPALITAGKARLAASARLTLQHLDLHAGDKALLCLPVHYIAGKMMVVRALTGHLDLRLTPPAATPAIRENYDFSAMTPHQAASVLRSAGGREKLARIKKLLIGGGPLSQELEKALSTLKTDIRHTYGMTETFSHIAMRKITRPGRSRWFEPLPGIRISLSVEGTLIVHAPHLSDRPLHTRDLAVTDGKGRFRITGRSDNIINTGGVKISPEEVEEQLAKMISPPFFLSSLPDPVLGERIVLIVRRKKLSPRDLEEIRRAVEVLPEKISRPRQVIALNRFILTPSGKLQRNDSKTLAREKGTFYDL